MLEPLTAAMHTGYTALHLLLAIVGGLIGTALGWAVRAAIHRGRGPRA